jgi:hypothetical protein
MRGVHVADLMPAWQLQSAGPPMKNGRAQKADPTTITIHSLNLLHLLTASRNLPCTVQSATA